MLTDCHVSISLDGYLAGPDQSLEAPLGVDGERVHAWHMPPAEPASRRTRPTPRQRPTS